MKLPEPTVPGQRYAKVLNLKLSRFYIQIIVQVYGCQVTGGIVQESVLAAGVGRIYLVMLGPGLAVFRQGRYAIG